MNLISLSVNKSISKQDLIVQVGDVNYTWSEAVTHCFIEVKSPRLFLIICCICKEKSVVKPTDEVRSIGYKLTRYNFYVNI